MLNCCILYKNGAKLTLVTVADGIDTKKYMDENIPTDCPRIVLSKNYVLQNDLEFFDAWDIDTQANKITVNMPKARNIWRSQLRIHRSKEFNKLDVEFMKAIEDGNSYVQTVIAQKKKKLRNITAHPVIDQSETIDALRKCTLEKLIVL
jgi:hypothetical protein